MIAARLAGGNLFFAFFGWRIFLVGDFGSTRSTRSSSEHSDFFEGDFVVGDFGSTRSTRIFFEGILLGGILFLWGVGGVLDCKCWKKLKND